MRTRVLVLQHPQEQDVELGTVPLLEAMVGAKRAVGLSWHNLSDALGEEAGEPRAWGVLYPMSLKKPPPPGPYVVVDPKGDPVREPVLTGIIALDGTWSQAKTLWWRNAWLLKCSRVLITPAEPSIYGKLRREPRNSFISTLEAVGDALVGNGEDPVTRLALRRVMRTMVQRARDTQAATR